jgi:UDP-N-acetyl-2-amino-2-deoxyglucuronate dehydrogenase
MRFALIGAGNISDTHARAIGGIAGASVAAVYGPTRARAERLATACGATAYDDLDRCLDHADLDMVAIGTPSGLHAAHGIAAARRRLHVLVEKPIDITTARADELIAEASRAGVTLGVIFQDRLKPPVRRLKALVDSGGLGTPIIATAKVKWYRPPAYYRDSRWRGTLAFDGGGAVINQAIHTVDLLVWIFGPVARVSAATATRLHDIEAEDTAVAAIEFANGALGTIEATTSAYPGYARRIELTGSEGTAILDGDRLIALDLRSGTREIVDEPEARVENVASPVVSDPTPHRRVFEDFIRAAESGGTPSCDGSAGRRSLETIEAIYQSARSGTPVSVKGEGSSSRA